jgi:class 3 adenylate cyclase
MSETRKLAAILVADIVGYSRLAGTDEERTLARVRALHSDLMDPTIAVHRGRVVKRTGDGSIVEFRSVVDAVRCAIEVQNGMIERNAGVPPERRIEYRVGIHLGDVVEESDGDLMGDGVNIAARLEGVAKPGAICLSEQAYWQVKGRLDLKVTDLGATLLKNIAEPIHVYSLEVGQQAAAGPAPSASPTEPLPSARQDDHRAAIRRIRAKRGFGLHATIYVVVNMFLMAVWALADRGYFWPVWPILGWGVALGIHYWAVFFRRPISQDEIRREMEKGR